MQAKLKVDVKLRTWFLYTYGWYASDPMIRHMFLELNR